MVQSKDNIRAVIEAEGAYVVPVEEEETHPRISIVIPLHNEQGTIREVIERIPDYLNAEIIVVDDGSTDGSAQKAQEARREIKVVRHERNQGYGAALLTGFKHASGDIIVTMDSDGQHRPEEIPNFIAPILKKKADVVVGSRYLGTCNFKVPLYTRLGEFCINKSLWLLYRQKVGNNQNGFRAYHKRVFPIFNRLQSNGMGIGTEILFSAAHHGFRIMEMPMTAEPRAFGLSYVNVLRVFKTIISILLIYMIKRVNFGPKNTLFYRTGFRTIEFFKQKGFIY